MQLAAGLLLLAVNVAAVVLLARRTVPWRTVPGRRIAVLLGSIAALVVVGLRYPYAEKYKALGFPVPAAAFETATGFDFVSPLTLPILVVDLALVGFAPAAGAVVIHFLRKRNAKAAA